MDCRQQTLNFFQRLRVDTMMLPDAARFRDDQACIAQHFEMMRDSRLCQIEVTFNIAAAQRAIALTDQTEHLNTHRMTERFEDTR